MHLNANWNTQNDNMSVLQLPIEQDRSKLIQLSILQSGVESVHKKAIFLMWTPRLHQHRVQGLP